ncbi:MAG TPA: YihY/virulence factor BrkB family protein [Gemmatimonadaceae bacterium]|nr:YihY/virulence factor BrkB family protein [Gemmatimonadaceae bacterium]
MTEPVTSEPLAGVDLGGPPPSTPAPISLGSRITGALLKFVRTLGAYIRHVWDVSNSDNIIFLAAAIAFNILLAALPFALLVLWILADLLGLPPDESAAAVRAFVEGFLPNVATGASPLHDFVSDALRLRTKVGIFGVIGYLWFSTRLWGTLRSALAEVFDVEKERGIVSGKLFDLRVTVLASLLLVAYTTLNAYLALSRSWRAAALGLRDDIIEPIEYALGLAVAFVVVTLIFFALYKFLPNRSMRWQTALVGALSSAVLFEIARNIYAAVTRALDPGSLYTGALYAIISVVFWAYYAALLFLIGGEVAQVHDLRYQHRQTRLAATTE